MSTDTNFGRRPIRCVFGLMLCGVPALAVAAEQGVSTALPPPRSQGVVPQTAPFAVVAGAKISPWRPIFVGVDLCEASTQTPRPIQVRAVRVDLHEPSVDLLVTPSNGDEPRDCAARTTTEFLSEFNCQVAINAGYFDPFAKKKGDPLDTRGLALSRGDLYHTPAGWRFDTLLFSGRSDAHPPNPPLGKGGPESRPQSALEERKPSWSPIRAWIVKGTVPQAEIAKAYNGVAGEDTLLHNGRYGYLPDDRSITKFLHPRSVIGMSRDGRFLYIVAIDGRQPGYSEGTTKAETAEWLLKLGAYNAINLDGGGSTALAMQGADGQPVLISRPCGPPPGGQRRVATHIGVFAKSLPTLQSR